MGYGVFVTLSNLTVWSRAIQHWQFRGTCDF